MDAPERTVRNVDPDAMDLVSRADALADIAARRMSLGPASPEARDRARQLRDHLDAFVRPRAADIDAPLLVLLLGPTGSGKSSLLNAIAGAEVSRAGVVRPTTREAVLYATPEDSERIVSARRLARVADDRLLVVEAPKAASGVAIIDAPDIDSVERGNRELADVLVEACDVCVFVTTATRYADLVPWKVLRRVRERGLPLVVVLNRIPAGAEDRDVLLADARRVLSDATGGGTVAGIAELVTVTEGDVDRRVNGLARERLGPLLDLISRLAGRSDERRRVAAAALAAAVRGLSTLAHGVADDLEHEAIDAEALRRVAETSFADELAALSRALRSGALLRTEVLRRWHDFVGADQLTRYISSGLGRLRGLILSTFRGAPAAPVGAVEEEIAGTVEALALRHASEAARRTAAAWSERPDGTAIVETDATLWSASEAFAPAIREGLASWMHGTIEDVGTAGGQKRSISRVAALGVNVIGVAVMLAVFAHTAGLTGAELGVAAGTAFLNQKLLEALFGEGAMQQLIDRARARLDSLLTSLFAGERARFDSRVPPPSELRELARELRGAVEELPA